MTCLRERTRDRAPIEAVPAVRSTRRPRRFCGQFSQVLVFSGIMLLGGCGRETAKASPSNRSPQPEKRVARVVPSVVAVHPHDPTAFTQGLLWRDGALYESSGGYGTSSLRKVDPETGRIIRSTSLPVDVFGEGAALVGDRLVLLSWREQRALIYDLDDFSPAGELLYAGEGWGLCFDGEQLVMSNGSSSLTLRDPETFAITGRLPVTLEGAPLDRLNELECVGRYVYANIWGEDEIARIDSNTGRVDILIDASGLLPVDERVRVDVLNGIAFNSETGNFYLTGKYWPNLFEVTFDVK